MVILDVGLALIYILASLIVLFCLDISLHYLTSGRFTRAPLVFTGHILKCLMSHQGGPFILSPSALVLVLRVGVWKVVCKID